MKAITVKSLVKRYGDVVAVNGVSFEVNQGEIFALLGPNGAGKTTTVRMLTALTSIDEGEAYVNGYNVKREKKKVKSSIGVVQEISNLYEELTVEENLKFMAELYNAPKENVGRLIREFNLPAKRKFGKLSSGFQRRVAIAAALVHEPPVIFMDEPTNALDVHSAKQVHEMIGVLNKTGKTIFLTTHNMAEAEKLPHRIAIINRGKIVAIGSRNELRKLVRSKIRVKLMIDPISSRFMHSIEGYNPRFDGESLVVDVEDIDAFLEEFYSLKKELGFRVLHLSTELPSVEEVFLELTSERGDERIGVCGGCPL